MLDERLNLPPLLRTRQHILELRLELVRLTQLCEAQIDLQARGFELLHQFEAFVRTSQESQEVAIQFMQAQRAGNIAFDPAPFLQGRQLEDTLFIKELETRPTQPPKHFVVYTSKLPHETYTDVQKKIHPYRRLRFPSQSPEVYTRLYVEMDMLGNLCNMGWLCWVPGSLGVTSSRQLSTTPWPIVDRRRGVPLGDPYVFTL
ncbi:hypothetical protein BD626DRAFT_563020 [Schizophyllum amplum]|uniref:Uncharacterized protein n=1 Tax=Schizophyllum amplum TaxID=97359 RepID=A0A550CWT2_9AGAR|nr:hypothetical protein BD626DRAFT_563020 [Auriculariopsis ampla]